MIYVSQEKYNIFLPVIIVITDKNVYRNLEFFFFTITSIAVLSNTYATDLNLLLEEIEGMDLPQF